MLVYAASKDDVLRRLREDVFVKEGIWNIDQAQIYPFFRPKRVPIK